MEEIHVPHSLTTNDQGVVVLELEVEVARRVSLGTNPADPHLRPILVVRHFEVEVDLEAAVFLASRQKRQQTATTSPTDDAGTHRIAVLEGGEEEHADVPHDDEVRDRHDHRDRGQKVS